MNKLLLKSPELDLGDVPLFYFFFGSGSPTHRAERQWMLRLLLAALTSAHTAGIFRRRFVLELLMSYHDSSLADAAMRLLVLRVIQRVGGRPKSKR